ncbi:MAG: hypothetical protein AAGU11_10125 [Syntrophobacteraceae bacterium]
MAPILIQDSADRNFVKIPARRFPKGYARNSRRPDAAFHHLREPGLHWFSEQCALWMYEHERPAGQVDTIVEL